MRKVSSIPFHFDSKLFKKLLTFFRRQHLVSILLAAMIASTVTQGDQKV